MNLRNGLFHRFLILLSNDYLKLELLNIYFNMNSRFGIEKNKIMVQPISFLWKVLLLTSVKKVKWIGKQKRTEKMLKKSFLHLMIIIKATPLNCSSNGKNSLKLGKLTQQRKVLEAILLII